MEEKEFQQHTAKIARTIQRDLRLIAAASISFPLFAAAGFVFGITSIIVLLASLISVIAVYFLHYNSHGHLHQWWWMRSGPIVVLNLEDYTPARKWCIESNYSFFEIMPGVFKFFRTKDAVHFKLIWC
jgi:hypothetical protein